MESHGKSKTEFIPWEYDVAGIRALFCYKGYNLCQLLFLIEETLKGISKHCEKYVLEITEDGAEFFIYWLTAKCVNWKEDLAVFRAKGLILRNLKLNSSKKSSNMNLELEKQTHRLLNLWKK
jgi:hypothetical protein